jgi:hypothetical protein
MALNHFKPYSHYRYSEAATGLYEVVSPALFEVELYFPFILNETVGVGNRAPVLLQHVRSISGIDGVTPTIGTVVQKYKFAERHYAAAGPDKTSLELTVTYTLNLDDNHQNYVYNMLRQWYNLIYNPQNGQTLTKAMYAKDSRLVIKEHDRNGDVWRKITCLDFFPSTPPTGLNEDNYDSMGDAKTVSITFIVDDWVEQILGIPDARNVEGGDIKDESYTPVGDNTALGNIFN